MNDIVYIPKRLVFLSAMVMVLLIGAVVSLYAVRQPSETQTETHAQTISQNGQPVCKNQQSQDIVLVFDVSSSMTDLTNIGTTRLYEAKRAASSLVDKFNTYNNSLPNNQKYRIAVVRFADFVSGTKNPSYYTGPRWSKTIQGLTTNMNQVKNAINSSALNPPPVGQDNIDWGFTCTECGLRLANDALNGSSRKKSIILLTDGAANWRESTFNWYTDDKGDKYDWDTLPHHDLAEGAAVAQASKAKNAGVTVYTIGIGDTVPDNYGETYSSFVRQMASSSGDYNSSNSGSDLTKIYDGLVNQIVTPATGGISGIVFNDLNHNNAFDPPTEQGINGWPVTLYQNGVAVATDTTKNGGKYSFPNLCDGSYEVVEKVPSGWINVTPNPFTVRLSNGATQTANFGNYLSSSAWIQSEAFDVRIDQGFTDSFPPIVNSQWQGAYASVPNASYSKTPGVILGGSDAGFINGQASPNPYNWMVGDRTLRFPEKFTDTRPLSLSYASVYAKAYADGKKAPTDLSCKPGACSLLDTPSGYYHSAVPLTFNGLLVQAGSSYTIMVDGDVTINKAITVMPGGFLMIVSSGSIMVDQSVGVLAGSTADPQLQGFFVADKDFVVLDNGKTCNNGGISDNALYVAGDIVVNATRQGGRFVQQRKLCGTDAYNPVFRATPRLDMLLNFPNFLRTPIKTWKEVAP